MTLHPVLLGDSIFDNAAYIDGGRDVAAHLRGLLTPEDGLTLAAVDGSICSMVEQQTAQLPSGATHLVVSAGGNDILHHVALLNQSAVSFADGLATLADARESLAADHYAMLAHMVRTGLPVAVCMIYDANHPAPTDRLVRTALGLFNDVITRNATRLGCDLIDLRLVCDERADYANPIEPSVQGGAKIAAAIRRYLGAETQQGGPTRVFH